MAVLDNENSIRNSRQRLVSARRPQRTKKLPFNGFRHLIDFINTPFVKFVYNQGAYLLFLILYSYVILCDFNPLYNPINESTSLGLAISIPEIVLIIWVLSFAAEFVRRFFFLSEHKVWLARFKHFFSEVWNSIEASSIIIFLVGVILRFIPNSDACFVAARIIISIDIMLFFFRSLYTYVFLESLGPKLYMIAQMVVELLYFLLIIVLFMFAFGISSQSLMFPNSDLDSYLLRSVFFPAYFVSAGEYMSRTTLMAAAFGECTNETTTACPTCPYPYNSCPDEVGANITLAIYVVYLVFLNILLINLLIAIFNNTYSSIQADAKKIWCYQRYGLVYDFHSRSIFTPPFCLLYYLYLLLKELICLICDCCRIEVHNRYAKAIYRYLRNRKVTSFICEFSSRVEENQIIRWERSLTGEVIVDEESKLSDTIDNKVDMNQDKLDVLASKFEEFMENGDQALNDRMNTLNANIDRILKSLKG